MKKPLLLSVLFIALITALSPQKAAAQITGIAITTSIDSTPSPCILPATDLTLIYGTLTGTVPSGDSVTIYINFGDGSDVTYKIPDYSSGGSTGGSFNTYYNHTYTIPGTYTPYVTATTTSSITATYTDLPFTLSNTCAQLTGKLYVDANSNCTDDAGELGIAYVPLIVVNTATSDTTWGGWTDDTGYYAIDLLPGSYKIIADPSLYSWYWYTYGGSSIAPTCPSSGMYSLTAVSGASYTENFAFNCTPMDSLDVSAHGWNWCFVPGDTTWVEVWVGNWWWYWDFTCTSLSSTVTLTLDPHLTYAGYDAYWGPAPASVSGGTITWNYTSSSFFGFWELVRVVCSSSATLGDTLCNTIYASPTSLTDPNLANNTEHFCGVVNSSYDPNGKEVSPQGLGAQGYINNNTPLTYMIHFQNTGTAPAENITLVDTLSANVDPQSFHILQSSAPAQVYTSGNLVKIRFNNINLPDSAANPNASVGSVVYAVMPKSGLAPGTQIKNKAGIYFDYNPAVVTNTTLNTIIGTTYVQHISNNYMKATVYPNPAGDNVFANTDDKSEFTVNMMDMLGRTVAADHSVNGSVKLNTQSLPTGLYIVSLGNADGKELTTKVTIQH